MTGQVFQSDLDLIQKLIEQGNADTDIIAVLARRRIDPIRGAQVVAELRQGRPVVPDSPIPVPLAITPRPSARTERPSRPRAPARTASAETGRPSVPRSERPSTPAPLPAAPHPRTRPLTRPLTRQSPIVLAGLAMVLFVVVAALMTYFNSRDGWGQADERVRAKGRTNAPASLVGEPAPASNVVAAADTATSTTPTATAASTNAMENPAQKLSSHGLVVEIQSSGLQFAGYRLTPQNALQVVAGIVGEPTRTNLVEKSQKTIYAFDKHGVLLYAQANGEVDHLVLDFDGMGGATGANLPFVGTVALAGEIIRARTAAKTLAEIKSLKLTHPGDDPTIFGCQYSSFRLYFAYLRSSEQLSMVEVDLQ